MKKDLQHEFAAFQLPNSQVPSNFVLLLPAPAAWTRQFHAWLQGVPAEQRKQVSVVLPKKRRTNSEVGTFDAPEDLSSLTVLGKPVPIIPQMLS